MSTELDHDDVRIYHTRMLLTTGYQAVYPETLKKQGKALTPIGQEVATKLNDVMGVDGFGLCRYRVTIVKGGAFAWNEVEAAVLQVLDGG